MIGIAHKHFWSERINQAQVMEGSSAVTTVYLPIVVNYYRLQIFIPEKKFNIHIKGVAKKPSFFQFCNFGLHFLKEKDI